MHRDLLLRSRPSKATDSSGWGRVAEGQLETNGPLSTPSGSSVPLETVEPVVDWTGEQKPNSPTTNWISMAFTLTACSFLGIGTIYAGGA